MPFSGSAVFLFHLFYISKMFPFEDSFHPGTQTNKISLRVRLGEQGRVGHKDRAVFGMKLLNTQCGVGRCARKSPIMKPENALKEPSKKIHQSQTQPLIIMPAGALIQMGS